MADIVLSCSTPGVVHRWMRSTRHHRGAVYGKALLLLLVLVLGEVLDCSVGELQDPAVL